MTGGGGYRACDVTLIKKFIVHMKHEILSGVNFLSLQMYSHRRGRDKNHPEQNLRIKTPRTIEREFVEGAFVRVFCTRPTKNRGVRDV